MSLRMLVYFVLLTECSLYPYLLWNYPFWVFLLIVVGLGLVQGVYLDLAGPVAKRRYVAMVDEVTDQIWYCVKQAIRQLCA